MFKDLNINDAQASVKIHINGIERVVPARYTVAAALLVQPQRHPRIHPVSNAPREPLCLMGGCFECLVEIDGIADRQACLFEVKEGMQVSTKSLFETHQQDPEGLAREL